MTAHVTITLDTAPPASPVLLINGGADRTGDVVVMVALATPSADVTEMKIWGDLDPTANPLFQPTEGASQWTLWTPEVALRLSAGTGRKYLYARLKDDVCNETPAFTDWIDFDADLPVVSVTNPPDRTRISATAPCDTTTFSWECSHPFTTYQVRVVPSIGSPHAAGVLIGTAHGSVGTSGLGSFAAAAPLTTVVTGADLLAASPGDGPKIVKVFARDSAGAWSP